MRIVKLYIAFFLLFSLSCKKESFFWEAAKIKKLASLIEIIPPPPILIRSVYIINNDASIAETNIENLWKIYLSHYKKGYKNFCNFLFDVLNQKIKLDNKDKAIYLYYLQSFKIDSNISLIYKNENLNGLIKRYCIRNKDFYTLSNTLPLTLNQTNSIAYYFFINQFIKVIDDYHAEINFKRLSI